MSDHPQPGPTAPPIESPPAWFWMLPATVACLRTLPFFWLQFASPPQGAEFIGVSFIPKDFLAYLAFIRQVGDNASCLFYNPFTTDPQTPRFILLFHWLLGVVAALTGAPPNWVLELSRIPLVFVFFWMLWRFLAPLLSRRSDRLWACVLVGFSGGLEGFVRPFVNLLPAPISSVFFQETWELYGWSTFAAFFNPLWIASMTLGLYLLRPVLAPEGTPRRAELARIGGGFLLAYFIHPYLAIFIVALGAVRPALEWILEPETEGRRIGSLTLTGAIALLFCVAVGQWQSLDEVYRSSATGVFGTQNVSIFWCPITLGVVGVLALRGFALWCGQAHPYRVPVAAWVITVVFLQTSPVLNGYKFVFLLHLPLCILAAPAVGNMFNQVMARAGKRRWLAVALVSVALFSSPAFVTVNSIRTATEKNCMPADYARIVKTLALRQAGNALVPPDLGNVIPAFTPDRVWVGQWFLTPEYTRKVAAYRDLVGNPKLFVLLEALIREQHIRYFVAPKDKADQLSELLGKRVQEQLPHGNWVLFVLGQF